MRVHLQSHIQDGLGDITGNCMNITLKKVGKRVFTIVDRGNVVRFRNVQDGERDFLYGSTL